MQGLSREKERALRRLQSRAKCHEPCAELDSASNEVKELPDPEMNSG
jgi:hypothetical protein